MNLTNTWDYRNRLTESGNGISTSTFAYDYTYDRVLKNSIRYPNKFYNTDSSHTKHVFSPQGDLIATIIGTTASTTATTTYAHTDHLGGTSATTNSTGRTTELSDFYPYGTSRVSLNYTGSPEQRKYAGTERDLETGMDYMQHRYYRADQGRFISIDPVFYEVGITRDGKTVLMDPQGLNSYAYASNNPINLKDPSGRCPWCLPFLVGGVAGGVSQLAVDLQTGQWSSWQEYNNAVAFGAGAAAAAVFSLPAAGAVSLIGSITGDVSGERDIDPWKAGISGAVTIVTGGIFRFGAGAAPAYVQGSTFFSTPSWAYTRYVVAGEIFNASASAIAQGRGNSNGGVVNANVPGGSIWIINGVAYDLGDHKTTAPVILGPVTPAAPTQSSISSTKK